ncbi:MAG: alpha-amylase family protein, partial [Gemmatimonadota bacterium]
MPPRLRTAIATLLALVVVGSGCADDSTTPPVSGTPSRPTLDPAYRASGHMAAGDVVVHLFEWKWTDVASECENVLGPLGFQAVQVSPPQEHILESGFPWWQRYQPVSYGIERSRSGSGAEFSEMVERCRAAGVDIYVDAVINHMTAGAGTGSDGTVYTKYHYPGLYAQDDFHPPCTVNDYHDAANVQDCELFGLADLHTGRTEVRARIADYLIGLVRLGVAGFRLDAAKHIQPVELDAILDRVNEAAREEGLPLPYVFAEVIDPGSEAVKAMDYYGLGYGSGGAADITEFRFRGIVDKFAGTGGQRLADLAQFSASSWGLMPADKAVVFVENHDTQRDGGISYRDGDVYRLANVWMLAQPYGYPKVMSSYAFDLGGPGGRDAGPPSDALGATLDVSCTASLETATLGEWVCEHRDPAIAGMVGFRRAVAGTGVNDWWDNGANAIAFSRGGLGFVALNLEDSTVAVDAASALPQGTYCDVLTGGLEGGTCGGRSVVVGPDGRLQLELEAGEALAIHT